MYVQILIELLRSHNFQCRLFPDDSTQPLFTISRLDKFICLCCIDPTQIAVVCAPGNWCFDLYDPESLDRFLALLHSI